jgi:hypothetical protein
MGAGYRHTCDRCSYTIDTSGPWEFYRDLLNQRKPYGHPGPMSQEAEERGVAGYYAIMYCLVCNQKVDVILQEFRPPVSSGFEALARISDSQYGGNEARCPNCGVGDLVLGPREDAIVVCPQCRKGTMVGNMLWIS